MDPTQDGLLDGLQGADREARRRLLQRLREDGASERELREAVREDRLALLLVERRLGGRHTARELEQISGVPAATLLHLRRQLGLPVAGPDDVVFTDADVEQARALKQFIDAGFSLETMSELSRVMGESMSRLAATVAAAGAETFLRPGDSEADVAERLDRLTHQLTPALTPVMAAAFSAHLRESVRRARLLQEERERGRVAGQMDLVVCFADLVGFTRLGGELEVEELGSLAGQLADLATELARPPVRLVKTIGDAVMLVSPEAAPLVRAALKLVEAAERRELPSLRAGIACGPTVQRAGDFFGHTVNLASRVTGVARPGSVLAIRAVRDQARDELDWSYAGRFRLKGLAESEPLYRAHLPEPDAEPAAISPSKRAGRRRKRASS
ncbi:MAG TPA: adenylate cyclase regulatory domain-containing protein [Solirubrobacteraceae bacterium]|nr:adenylate cyclase regulatory domain-containing protein [Solirubrobacteraceae bacterium]